MKPATREREQMLIAFVESCLYLPRDLSDCEMQLLREAHDLFWSRCEMHLLARYVHDKCAD